MPKPQYIDHEYLAVTGATAESSELRKGGTYVLTSTVNAWFKLGASAGSVDTRADGAGLLVAGQERLIQPTEDGQVLLIEKDDDEANGHASLSRIA